MKKTVLLIFGTRPEAIKLAPVYNELKVQKDSFNVKVAVTAQHRGMLDQVLNIFSIKPDYDLDVMENNQTLFNVTSKSILGLEHVLNDAQPDCVLVQGDTTTTFIGGLAAFYKKIKVGHIEAGLRTFNKYSPFPEEMNRKLTGAIADFHFPPTEVSKQNLLSEGINDSTILVTGNTSIDALLWVLNNKQPDFNAELGDLKKKEYVLITSHRRESFGKPMEEAFNALKELATKYKSYKFIFPVHPNPNVREKVENILSDASNVLLTDPVGYVEFAHLMKNAKIIISDSGGIQEEAPALNVPVLVLRNDTERPEGIKAGTAKLVGTNRDNILYETAKLLDDAAYYASMASSVNPYGDGKASVKICNYISSHI